MSWRYIAQRILTGEFLDWEVPLNRTDMTWTLSGAGALRGTVAPDVGALRTSTGSPLFEEWGTALYAEKDGEIRWGGILTSSKFKDGEWALECSGFATYPFGIPFLGTVSHTSIEAAQAFRILWAHIQNQPDGYLGVQIVGGPTGYDIATKDEPWALAWHEAKDVGQEINNVLTESGMDYAEDHYWDGDKIAHRITLGTPSLGRRRFDLAFIMGDNITNVVEAERNGEDFANEVIALGAGEGAATIQARIPQRDGRLRRPAVYTDKSVTSTARMSALARAALATRRNTLEIESVEVLNHPHAPIGSWSLGDDVLIQADLPWLGDVAIWHRVMEWSLLADDRARLTLVRSDSFA